MSPDAGLDDLYREVILDHYRNPRNKGTLASPSASCEGVNPLCGDEIHLALDLSNGTLADIRFAGRGCAISQASASMMTETLKGKPLPAVAADVASFKAALTGAPGRTIPPEWGDVDALEGVKKYPVRIKCALLAWETLLLGLSSKRAG